MIRKINEACSNINVKKSTMVQTLHGVHVVWKGDIHLHGVEQAMLEQ
jgi:hypothetical protein